MFVKAWRYTGNLEHPFIPPYCEFLQNQVHTDFSEMFPSSTYVYDAWIQLSFLQASYCAMLKSARYPVSDPPKMSRMALVRHSIMKLLLDRDNVIIQNIPTKV